MIALQIKADIKRAQRQLGGISPQVITPALRQAGNDAARKTKTAASRILKEQMGLRRVKLAKDALRAILARPGAKPRAAVEASGKSIPVSEFKGVRAGKSGVTGNLMGRDLHVSRGFRNKAIAAGKRFFVREGQRRLPIRQIYGPPVPIAFVRSTVTRRMDTVALQTFRNRLQSHISRRINRIR